MSIDVDDLLKVIGLAKVDCSRLGAPLDTEIICVRYNEYREKHGQKYSYDIREMQVTLADLVRSDGPESSPKLNGSISYVDGKVLKVVIFGLQS
ncbi:hypothetical protein [Pseudomonas sp. ZL2]